jgi:mono/diheme cytochrome c family protein
MTRTFIRIFVFMLAIVSVYAYVGQLVPQFEEHPPKKRVITTETPTGELVGIGQELLRGKGGCLVCHKDVDGGNERGPDLRQAAAKAAQRKPGMSVDAYLMESLLYPEAFLVPGYPKMMPAANKPPANLSSAEVKAVVAYMQSLGGLEPTVKVLTEDVAAAKKAAGGPVHRGRALMEQHGCLGCHKAAGEGGEVGPDLTKTAASREPADILKKLADPAAWTTSGYAAGIMTKEITQTIPEGDRQEMVAYLAGLAGKHYSAAGELSPWSHEGVRLGLVILVFNLGMLLALAVARRNEKKGEAA